MDQAEAGRCGLRFPRPSLYVIEGGAPPDQAPRLQEFRDEHPDVEIVLRDSTLDGLAEKLSLQEYLDRLTPHELAKVYRDGLMVPAASVLPER